jgi:hypothetical protein
MDTSISLRINDHSRQWGGNNSSQGDRQNRRKQKLEALFQSISAGDLDYARQAFTALVNFDLSVASDPYLNKIGAALQSSNLYAAKHFAHELLRDGLINSTQTMADSRRLQFLAFSAQCAQLSNDF